MPDDDSTAEFMIVGANGTMNLPIGWALPIVSTAGVARVLGSSTGFPYAEIAGFETEGHLTRIPETKFQVPRSVLENEHHEADLLKQPLYVLYHNASMFQKHGIEIPCPWDVSGKQVSGATAKLELFVVTNSALLSALSQTRAFLNARVAGLLGMVDWSKPIVPSIHQRLAFLTSCLHQIAVDRGSAIRAIALRGLMLQGSESSHMTADWLKAACKRWQGLDPSIEKWTPRFTSLVEEARMSETFHLLHSEAIEKLAAKLLEERDKSLVKELEKQSDNESFGRNESYERGIEYE